MSAQLRKIPSFIDINSERYRGRRFVILESYCEHNKSAQPHRQIYFFAYIYFHLLLHTQNFPLLEHLIIFFSFSFNICLFNAFSSLWHIHFPASFWQFYSIQFIMIVDDDIKTCILKKKSHSTLALCDC